MNILQSDVEQRSFNGENLPLFVYSYSSRGFPDLIERLEHSLPHIPSYLLSLYDYEYNFPSGLILPEDARIRIWDSGGYETMVCPTCQHSESLKKWDENTYIRTATRIPWNGFDVLVSYDTPYESKCVQQQIERALDLYTRVKGTYARDLLIHIPSNTDPDVFVKILGPYTNEFQILGLTEKEIAPTWAHGVYFINRLRSALSTLKTEHYIPIHVFGCFDFKTMVRFALAGADMFDGLTWLRHLFLNGETLYRRETEYVVSIEQLLATNMELSMILHNVRSMEQLRSDLIYAMYTNNMEGFEKEMSDISKVLDIFSKRAFAL